MLTNTTDMCAPNHSLRANSQYDKCDKCFEARIRPYTEDACAHILRRAPRCTACACLVMCSNALYTTNNSSHTEQRPAIAAPSPKLQQSATSYPAPSGRLTHSLACAVPDTSGTHETLPHCSSVVQRKDIDQTHTTNISAAD
jgi:hypothetical protein